MNGELHLNPILIMLSKTIENSLFTQFVIPFFSDIISAIIVAILTIFIARFFNKRDEWLEIRSGLLDYHNSLRKMIVDLADNPSCYNHQHFIAYFSNDLTYIRNLSDKINDRHRKKVLKRISEYISIEYKEILLNDDNEAVLNVDGKTKADKYGAFIIGVDAFLLKVNEMILEK